MAARLVIDIQIEDLGWRAAWPSLSRDAPRMLRAAVRTPNIVRPVHGSVVVVFADDAKLKLLNSRFRGKRRPTNVLSFPDRLQPLGGIALGLETIRREARAQKKEFVNHSKHMILHGFLHLLGYDHETVSRARLMEGLEIAILSQMGIPNPYVIETKRA